MSKRFYKAKLYKFKLDQSINIYLGKSKQANGYTRDFKQILPSSKHPLFFSPVSFDKDYEVYECFLLEVLLGLYNEK